MKKLLFLLLPLFAFGQEIKLNEYYDNGQKIKEFTWQDNGQQKTLVEIINGQVSDNRYYLSDNGIVSNDKWNIPPPPPPR